MPRLQKTPAVTRKTASTWEPPDCVLPVSQYDLHICRVQDTQRPSFSTGGVRAMYAILECRIVCKQIQAGQWAHRVRIWLVVPRPSGKIVRKFPKKLG
jgi:hypothetical protein